MPSVNTPPPPMPDESVPQNRSTPKPFSSQAIAHERYREDPIPCVYGPPPPSVNHKTDTVSKTKQKKILTRRENQKQRVENIEPTVYELPSIDEDNDSTVEKAESHTSLWIVLGIVAVICICILIWLL